MNEIDKANDHNAKQDQYGKVKASWRVKTGFAIFIVSIAWPVLMPLLPLLGVPTTATAMIAGVMVVAAELMMLAGAAIAGKQGFKLIKQTVIGKLKAFGPPVKVSKTRYRIGLAMFLAPLLLAWAGPYVGHHLPGYEANVLVYAIGGDLIFLTSLFLLGGDFWDKLRSLFVHDATAVMPKNSPERRDF
jgi:hypothetical protein